MLTNAQIAQAKATANPASVSPSIAMTPEQAHAWISEKSTVPVSSPLQQMSTQFNQGAQQFSSSIDALKSAPDVHPEEIAGTTKDLGKAAGFAEALAQALRAPLKAAGELGSAVMGAGTAALSPLAPVFNAASKVGEKIGEAVPLPIANAVESSASNKVVSDVAPDIFNMSALMAPRVLKGATPGIEAAGTGIRNLATKAGEVASNVSKAQEARITSLKVATEAKNLQKVADEWKSPTIPGKSTNPASFNKATSILEQSPEIPQFLTGQKLHPADFIEGGRYATADAADGLVDTAGKMSRDVLRPSLQEADKVVAKTPVIDVIKEATANIKNDPAATPGITEARARLLGRAGDALQRKYPNGLSLVNMLDNKIKFDLNGKWKPDATVGDSQIAAMNRDVAGAMRDVIKAKSPPSLPVGDFWKYTSQYYKAADYLNALNTKKAPVSLAKYLAHRGAQVTGAVIGHNIGGGILGGVGGYMMGGALEHAVENMIGPMRSMFLQNLKISNPEAFTKVQEFISKEEAGRMNRPALPAGPIKMGRGSDTSGAMMIPATKTPLPTVNPKTGRMQTTYLSGNQSILDKKSPMATTPTMVNTNPKNANIAPTVTPNESVVNNPEAGFIRNPFAKSGPEQTIERHLTSAEQVMENMSAAEFNKNGGVPAFITHVKTNIVDGLKAEGHEGEAKAIMRLDPLTFSTFDSFAEAAQKVIKNYRPPLPLDEVAPGVDFSKPLGKDKSTL